MIKSGRTCSSWADRRRLLVPTRARFHQVKGLPAAGDQHVAGLFPPGDRTDAKSFGNIGGHVFHAVHCQVDASIQQGFFNLLDEQAFAANFGQGDIQDFVSTGFDDGQFDGDVRMVGADGIFDPVGLPQGQLAAPGADGDGAAGHQWPHPAQLEALHPVHDEAPADWLTVSPPLPLLTNPQVDISRQTLSALQSGHWSGSLPPITRYSKS
jgi:hypothetical protein